MTEESFSFTPESQYSNQPEPASTSRHLLKLALQFSLFILMLCIGLSWYISSLNKPSDSFPISAIVTIEKGTEVREITRILKQENVVQSATLLYYILVLFYDPTDIKASAYFFEKPLTTFEVAERITQGDFDTDLIRFTHYEGERVTVLAKRARALLPNFNSEAFVVAATPHEGKLFPDTYFVPADYTDSELLALMLSTFEQKVSELDDQVQTSDFSIDEILILASLIEREANTPESKKMISGIFQNRLDIGMPLQADASVEYILDKPLSELTPTDLEVDSPYNTYLNIGLPPTPIGNPGLESIEAVLNPTGSDYFYYLTDEDGEFYYSRTYAEHLRNIDRYLR